MQPVQDDSTTGPRRTRLVQSERLRRGIAFHHRVQTAFLTGLMGTDAAPERVLTLVTGRTGRVDLFVIPQLDERMAVVVEIKNTDWDALDEHRVRPNIRRHIRQLQNYLDTLAEGLDTGLADETLPIWDSIDGALLYPARPVKNGRAQLVETLSEDEALMIVFFDETAWR